VQCFEEDIDLALETAKKLDGLPLVSSFIAQVTGKAALLAQDYGLAEQRYLTGLNEHQNSTRLMGDFAALLLAGGREVEAREWLTRSMADLDDGWKTQKKAFNEKWNSQFHAALAGEYEPVNKVGELGASANYCDAEIWHDYWVKHREECSPGNTNRTTSAYTNHVMFAEIEHQLASHKCPAVISYGCLAGQSEVAFAAQHPEVKIVGYDVCADVTVQNSDTYSIPNLRFSSCVDDCLSENALFCHNRTMDIILPDDILATYEKCYEAGVKLIVSAEYHAVCWDSLTWPDFSTNTAISAHWDGIVMVHNIPNLLDQAGYTVTLDRFVPIPLIVSASGEGLQPAQMIRLVVACRRDSIEEAAKAGGRNLS